MAHIQDTWNSTINNKSWHTVTNIDGKSKVIRHAEKYAVHIENQIRAEHGVALRTHYAYNPNGSGFEPTRMINATNSTSLYYTQSQTHNTTRIVSGIPVTTSTIVPVPFVYRGY